MPVSYPTHPWRCAKVIASELGERSLSAMEQIRRTLLVLGQEETLELVKRSREPMPAKNGNLRTRGGCFFRLVKDRLQETPPRFYQVFGDQHAMPPLPYRVREQEWRRLSEYGADRPVVEMTAWRARVRGTVLQHGERGSALVRIQHHADLLTAFVPRPPMGQAIWIRTRTDTEPAPLGAMIDLIGLPIWSKRPHGDVVEWKREPTIPSSYEGAWWTMELPMPVGMAHGVFVVAHARWRQHHFALAFPRALFAAIPATTRTIRCTGVLGALSTPYAWGGVIHDVHTSNK